MDSTDVMIIFLSGSVDTATGYQRSEYMHSRNCLRELRAAVEKFKPCVFVLETDPSHGAVDLATHRRDCPEDLRHALDEHPVVPWFRVRAFAQVSLTLILERVLGEHDGKEGRWRDAELCIAGSVADAPPALLKAPQAPFRYHLYVSSSNPGASEVAELLSAEASRHVTTHVGDRSSTPRPKGSWVVSVTHSAEDRHAAQVFLLYLHETTFQDNDTLVAEVSEALARGARLLLVHEQRSHEEGCLLGHHHESRCDGKVPFRTIIERTPRALLDANVYADLATPLYSGERYQRASLRLMLNELAKAPLLSTHPAFGLFASWRRERSRSQRSMAEYLRRYPATNCGSIQLDDTNHGREDDNGEVGVMTRLRLFGPQLVSSRWLARLRVGARAQVVTDERPPRGESEMATLSSKAETRSARL